MIELCVRVSHVQVVCDGGGCVGRRDVGGCCHPHGGSGTSASPILSASLWEGPGRVDRAGWLRHRVLTVYRFSGHVQFCNTDE